MLSYKLNQRDVVLRAIRNRYRHRFFDRVGHETIYASSGNKLFPLNDVENQNFEMFEEVDHNFGDII